MHPSVPHYMRRVESTTPHTASIHALSYSACCLTPHTALVRALSQSTHCLTPHTASLHTASLHTLPHSTHCLTTCAVSLCLLSNSTRSLSPRTVSVYTLPHSTHCLTPHAASLHTLSHSTHCLTPHTASLHTLSHSTRSQYQLDSTIGLYIHTCTYCTCTVYITTHICKKWTSAQTYMRNNLPHSTFMWYFRHFRARDNTTLSASPRINVGTFPSPTSNKLSKRSSSFSSLKSAGVISKRK